MLCSIWQASLAMLSTRRWVSFPLPFDFPINGVEEGDGSQGPGEAALATLPCNPFLMVNFPGSTWAFGLP